MEISDKELADLCEDAIRQGKHSIYLEDDLFIELSNRELQKINEQMEKMKITSLTLIEGPRKVIMHTKLGVCEIHPKRGSSNGN